MLKPRHCALDKYRWASAASDSPLSHDPEGRVRMVNPSSMPKRSGDRIKTDRRDGATLHRTGEFSAIYIPTQADEALARAGGSALLEPCERDAPGPSLIFELNSGIRRQKEVDLVLADRGETIEVFLEENRRDPQIAELSGSRLRLTDDVDCFLLAYGGCRNLNPPSFFLRPRLIRSV
jgi:hypothetical protein